MFECLGDVRNPFRLPWRSFEARTDVLSAWEVRESHLDYRGDPVKFVQAFSNATEVRQIRFKHFGCPMKFVQACSYAGQVRKSRLNHRGGHMDLVHTC